MVVATACDGAAGGRADGARPDARATAGDSSVARLPAGPRTSNAPAAPPGGGPRNAAPARRIVFVGTSLTAGLGLDPEQAFPARIGQRLDALGESYEVVNAGVSGETSAGTRRRIGWVLRAPASVLVLETGANDGLRGLNPDSLRANLQAIVDTVRAVRPRTRIVLVGMEAPPNLGAAYTARFRAVYAQVARANGLPFVPFLLAGVAGVDSLNQGDGIHPNALGARIVANTVWRTLAPLVDARPAPGDSVAARGRR